MPRVNRWGKVFADRCEIPHHEFDRQRCELDLGHVGVHAKGRRRWYGGLDFPNGTDVEYDRKLAAIQNRQKVRSR